MPIYEYACLACNHQLEAFQNLREEPLKKCPKCGKNKLEKLVSATCFQLKGSGWYMTDYGNKEKANSKSSTATENTAGDQKQSTSDTTETVSTEKLKEDKSNEQAA